MAFCKLTPTTTAVNAHSQPSTPQQNTKPRPRAPELGLDTEQNPQEQDQELEHKSKPQPAHTGIGLDLHKGCPTSSNRDVKSVTSIVPLNSTS